MTSEENFSRRGRGCLGGWLLLLLLVQAVPASASTIVRFDTSMGLIDVRLYNAATPLSVANFLNYATSNRYNGTFIHRVPQLPPQQGGGTADFVVQGGGFRLNNSIFAAAGIATDPPIGDEPGISNIRGALSFAKNAQGATSQWFFNIGNNSFLDNQNFTAFGRVLGNGMVVVDAVNNLPAINAAAAQNAPGEDFDEIPVKNLQKVLSQNDIKNEDAVMINSINIMNVAPGDYNFDGVVNAADRAVWGSTLGSTTNAAADGNGDGIVNLVDYVIWRDSVGATGVSLTSGNGGAIAVPEPTSLGLLGIAAFVCLLARNARHCIFRPRT